MNVKNVLAAAAYRDDKMNKINLFETQRFFCDLYCLKPGQEQAVHTHADNDKVYYLLRGRARVTVGEEVKDLNEGEVVLAPAGVIHGIGNDSGAEAICLVFMAPHPGMKQ